jgi:hypothetical protein
MFSDAPFLRLGIIMAVVFTLMAFLFLPEPVNDSIVPEVRQPILVTVQNRTPFVEIPTFPGCRQSSYQQRLECTKQEYAQFVKSNLQKMEGRKGQALVRFTVDLAGKMQGPVLERGDDPHLTAEAMRLVGLLQGKGQHWVPGKIKGTPRAMEIGLLISFGKRCRDCAEVTVDIVEL